MEDPIPEDPNYENEHSKQKKKNNRRHKLLSKLLLDFTTNTTLHGLRYITERGLSIIERLFWIATFITSLCLCAYLIGKVWVKWETNPIIVSLSEEIVPVTELPFPAVTICPEAKIKQESYNYTMHKIDLEIFGRQVLEKLPKTSSEEEALNKFMEENPSITDLLGIDLVCSDYYKLYNYPINTVNYTAVQTIQKVAPQLHNILNYGTWKDRNFFPVTGRLERSLTREGVCFTFNGLRAEDMFHMDRIQSNYKYTETNILQRGWSVDKGYSSSSKDVYPHRGQGNGAEPDLVFYLNEVQDRDILCDGVEKGFKIYLHHPADLPQSSRYYYSVLPYQVASLAIKVNVMKTSDTLADYPLHIRQCYFPTERSLHYFKVYTPNNCQLECLTNYTLKVCGCVWFHMPHNDEIKLCSETRRGPCMYKPLDDISDEDEIKKSNSSSCQCLPLCNSVQYEAEVLKTHYNPDAYSDILSYAERVAYNRSKDNKYRTVRFDYTGSNIKVELYFKEPWFVPMQRSELFGLKDFLAEIGGLLGLFLGFSFLSIVEIFYFFSLKLACTIRRDNIAQEKDKGNQTKISLKES